MSEHVLEYRGVAVLGVAGGEHERDSARLRASAQAGQQLAPAIELVPVKPAELLESLLLVSVPAP